MCCDHVVLTQSDTKGSHVQHHNHYDLCHPGGIEAVHRQDLVDLVLAMNVHHDRLCSALTEAPGALCFLDSGRCSTGIEPVQRNTTSGTQIAQLNKTVSLQSVMKDQHMWCPA